ncbi:MAG: hypothetical protein P4M08_10530 [Oligoflexia bacterium]|nr:hypothetical protein [Oligoflexia bacterium]
MKFFQTSFYGVPSIAFIVLAASGCKSSQSGFSTQPATGQVQIQQGGSYRVYAGSNPVSTSPGSTGGTSDPVTSSSPTPSPTPSSSTGGTSDPVTTSPGSSGGTSDPVTTSPGSTGGSSDPVTSPSPSPSPSGSTGGSSDPVSGKPGSTGGSSDPVSGKPGSTGGSSDPVTTPSPRPSRSPSGSTGGSSDPVSGKPGSTGGSSDPVSGNPGSTGGSSDPVSGNPGSTSGSSDPVSSGSTGGGTDVVTCPSGTPPTITIVPSPVCGPAITTNQAILSSTPQISAVLYQSSNFAGNSATVVQAWDTSASTSTLQGELTANKPFQLSLNQPLASGKYTVVMYDASKVKAPYTYNWSNGSTAVAPIMDSIAHNLNYTSYVSVNGSNGACASITLPVIVGVNGDSVCQNAGTIDPLTVNLGNSPIVLTSQANGVSMDLDGNGTMEQISWFSNPASSAFMVNVSNGMPSNGAIGPQQLFGNYTVGPDNLVAPNGYDALAKYDSNGDGVIDSKDPIWSNLRLWKDLNHNGVIDSGELITLSQAGITSIELPQTVGANHIVKEKCKTDQYGNVSCQGRNAYVNMNSGSSSSRQPLVDISFKPLQ